MMRWVSLTVAWVGIRMVSWDGRLMHSAYQKPIQLAMWITDDFGEYKVFTKSYDIKENDA